MRQGHCNPGEVISDYQIESKCNFRRDYYPLYSQWVDILIADNLINISTRIWPNWDFNNPAFVLKKKFHTINLANECKCISYWIYL